ncbi:hypothetical protein FQZ97_653200 [compost metagenome]
MRAVVRKQIVYVSPLHLSAGIAFGIMVGGAALLGINHLYDEWQFRRGMQMAERMFPATAATPTPTPAPVMHVQQIQTEKPGCRVWKQIYTMENDPKYKEQYRRKMLSEC